MKKAIKNIEFIEQQITDKTDNYNVSKIKDNELIYRIILITSDYIGAMKYQDLVTEISGGMALYALYQEAKKRFSKKQLKKLIKTSLEEL